MSQPVSEPVSAVVLVLGPAAVMALIAAAIWWLKHRRDS